MSEIICLILQEICFERRFEVSSVYAGDRERSIKETVVSCAKSCIQCHELWQVLYYLCSHFFFIRFTADTNSARRAKWCNPVVGVVVWQQLSPRHSEAGTSQHVYDSLMRVLRHVVRGGNGRAVSSQLLCLISLFINRTLPTSDPHCLYHPSL